VPLHTGLLEQWDFQIISMMKLKMQDMATESLFSARDQIMNPNNVGAFLKMPEKVATENNVSDTPGYNFNIEKSGIQNK
jgi:hypothetical protein